MYGCYLSFTNCHSAVKMVRISYIYLVQKPVDKGTIQNFHVRLIVSLVIITWNVKYGLGYYETGYQNASSVIFSVYSSHFGKAIRKIRWNMYIKLHSGRLANVEQFCRAEGKVFGSIETLIIDLFYRVQCVEFENAIFLWQYQMPQALNSFSELVVPEKQRYLRHICSSKEVFKCFILLLCEARAIAN